MISKDEPQVRLEYQLLDETTKKIGPRLSLVLYDVYNLMFECVAVSKKSKYYSQSEPFEIGRTEVER